MPTGTPASTNRQIYAVAGGQLEVKLALHRGMTVDELAAFPEIVKARASYAERFPPDDPQEWADQLAERERAPESERLYGQRET
jgi:hypothetical protein